MKLVDTDVDHVLDPVVGIPVDSECDLVGVKVVGGNQTRRKRVIENLARRVSLNAGEACPHLKRAPAAAFAAGSVGAEQRLLHARGAIFRTLLAGQQVSSAQVPGLGADAGNREKAEAAGSFRSDVPAL